MTSCSSNENELTECFAYVAARGKVRVRYYQSIMGLSLRRKGMPSIAGHNVGNTVKRSNEVTDGN